MNTLNRNLTALGLAVIAAAPMMAQESTGQIRGVVRSKSGKPLAGVLLEFSSPKLMLKRTITTNERGEYRAPLLPPGEYSIVASKSGYFTVPVRGIRLGLGQTMNQEISMPEQKTTEAVVEVVAASATQDKTDVKTQTVVSADQLEVLPGNNRGLEQAALLAPGVSTNDGGRISMRGGQALDTKFMLNGTDISDNIWGQGNSRNYYVDDAVAETQIISSPVHARYGGTTSGIVNAITKSGGNEFEGTLRVNLSSSSWSALRPLGPWRPNEGDSQGNKRPRGTDTMNRAWSFYVSGPIIKDRLWFSTSTKLDPPRSVSATMNTPMPGHMDAYSGKSLADYYGPYIDAGLIQDRYLGADKPFYYGANPGQPYVNITNNQFYELKLTGAITADHSLEVSGSSNKFNESKRLYGTSADLSALGGQSVDDKYFSVVYKGILASNMTLEAQVAKKWQKYGGGGDPSRGDRIRVKDDSGTSWQMNNATFSMANPDERNTRTVNLNLSILGLDFGKFGNHTFDVGGSYVTRNRRAANLQSPTGVTIYSLGSWMDGTTQRFIMARHDPGIDNGSLTGQALLDAMQADRDPNWDTMYISQVGSDSPTDTNIYSGYINDVITLNNHWQVNLGLRYDRTDVADTFGKPTIKSDSFSPRVQVTFDPTGDQRFLFRGSWARYTGTLGEGFTNQFSLAGNPISEYYTWKHTYGDSYTLADIMNRDNWDLTRNGFLYLDNPVAGMRVDPKLKAPSNDELSFSAKFTAQDRSYVNITYAQRWLKNPFDRMMVADGAHQVPGTAPSFPDISVPTTIEYWYNSKALKRDYKSLEIEFMSFVNSSFQIAGNYTYSILKGNVNVDSADQPVLGSPLTTYKEVYDAMGIPVERYAPYGNLNDDNRHKGRIWGTYTVGTSGGAELSLTTMLNYDGGTPGSLTRTISFPVRAYAQAHGADNIGQFPTASTMYYGPRGLVRENDTWSVDLKANLYIPLYKKIRYFAEITVYNVFNHMMLTGHSFSSSDTQVAWNSPTAGWRASSVTPVTANNGGTNYYGFGTYGYANYTTGRNVVVSTGVKW